MPALDESDEAQRARFRAGARLRQALAAFLRRWWRPAGLAAFVFAALVAVVMGDGQGGSRPGRQEAVTPATAPVATARGTAPAAPSATPAAPPAVLRSAPVSLPWTQARIEAGGRSVVVPRIQAGELPALVTSMLASPSDEAQQAAPATLRLELAQGNESAGVLELAGGRWRWTPLRGARGTRTLHPDPAVAAALRRAAEDLLGRQDATGS